MIPKVLSIKVNLETQTDLSGFTPISNFNIANDQNTSHAFEKPQISYDPEMVQGVIKPLGFSKDGTVKNHHIPRLYKPRTLKLIQNLKQQIDLNPAQHEEFVRQMAVALIPDLNNEDYHTLFTTPLQLPYRVVPGILKLDGQTETVPCTAVFSLDNTLSIITETQTILCDIDIWDTIISGRELHIIYGNEPFGKIQINETVQPVDFNKEIPTSLLCSLNVNTMDDLVCLFSPDDTSFVDVVLLIPTLSQEDANDLLLILHQKKLLAPYIRSKVCALQLSYPTKPRIWPELLGRFIFLLDKKWAYINIQHLAKNDVMAIFRHIKDMNGSALYVLQTAFKVLDEICCTDSIVFFWTLIFLSILQNAAFAKPQYTKQLQTKMLQIWTELQKKKMDSGTRRLSAEVIESIKNIERFKLSAFVHDEESFAVVIFQKYHSELFKILETIPYKKEESHPLFFPVVLALETALGQASRNEALITSESITEDSELPSTPSSRRSRHTSSRASEYSTGSDRGDFESYQSYASRSSRNSRTSLSSQRTTSSRNSRCAPPEMRDNHQLDAMSSGYSESYSSRRSTKSSRRAPPLIVEHPQQDVDEY